MTRMKRIVTSLVLFLALFAALLFALVPRAHAAALTSPAKCWGAGAASLQSCKGKDPTTMGCLASLHFLPYNRLEYYQGTLVGYFSSVYSNTCNANWDQATLSGDALAKGWKVKTLITTVDSKNAVENAFYPTWWDKGIAGVIPFDLACYDGSTGWPTVTDMVDGTNQTESTFYLCDQNNIVFWSDTLFQ